MKTKIISILFLGCVASQTQEPVQPQTNYVLEHQRRQCEEFAEEYAKSLRWCNDERVTPGARQASCQTARAWERDCVILDTDAGVPVRNSADAGISDASVDTGILDAGVSP